MTRLGVPTFKTREEEASFWDSTDLGAYMEDAEEITLEWTEREDRCKRCGGGMEHQRIDLHLAGGRVILRDVPLYVCRTPRCGNTQLPSAIRELAGRLEALVQETLPALRTPPPEPAPVREVLYVQRTPSPEPALVREEHPPYGEED